MTRLIYVAPRDRKQRKKPVRIDSQTGPAALLANVIGLAVSDYVCGNAEQSEAARFYFMSDDYQEHLSLLGLPGDLVPEPLQERIVRLDG